MGGLHLIVMCKAPVPGRVKTRLMSTFSAEEAAGIHKVMAVTVIHRALRLFDHVCIATDDPEHPFFVQFDAMVVPQGEGDLGARMARLEHAAFAAGAPSVMFLGTDSPHMPDSRLLEASDALAVYDTVIGPVEDGGYDLIALRGDWPVFEGVAWSTPAVLNQTLANLNSLGLRYFCLSTGFDVDTAEDVRRVERLGLNLV